MEQIAYGTPISSVLAWFRNHWTPGTCVGRLPRWDFRLLPRTAAWEDEHDFPRTLDGAVVCGLRKSCTFPDIKNGDVLVSINRGGSSVPLGKFGMVTDHEHGQPRFSIHNLGFVCSLATTTTVTVWRPSLKATRTFSCAPGPQTEAEKSYYQEYTEQPYACLGSMVMQNATPDFLRASEYADSDDESDGIPPVKSFQLLASVQAQRRATNPKHVVVLSHFHPDAYVSSTRTLEQGDIVTKLNGVALRNVQHAEKLVRKLAAEYPTTMGRKRVSVSTTGKKVFLNLDKLLQEETLCLPERDHKKLHLLTAYAKSMAAPSAPSAPKKRRSARGRRDNAGVVAKMRDVAALVQLQTTATPRGSRPSSRPSSPAQRKRRRSSRLLERGRDSL